MLRFLTRLGVTSLCEHPDDVSERVQIDLTEATAADKARERPVHPWFAVRAPTFARAAVVLTLLRGSQSFASVGESTTVEQLRALAGLPTDARPRILDLFAGTGAVAGAAGGWDCEADAVELNPVAHLITVASWTLAPALSDARGDWRGLADEVADHHQQIWTSARDRLRDVFKDGSYAYVWQLTLACPSCSCAVPFGDPTRAAPFLRKDVTGQRSRTRDQCPECGAAVDRRAAASTGQGWRLVAALADARAGIADVTTASQAAELVASQLASTMRELDGPAPDEIDHRIGAPRQALWMLELTVAARHVMDKLAERGLTTAQTEALELCGALCVSAMSEYAATGGRIDQRGRFHAGLRAGMPRAPSFAEPGLELLSTYWARRTELFNARFERSLRLTGAVRAHRADATALPFPDASFDAIVCDPPYFDNIQYADEAEPYRRWMQLATRHSVHQILDDPPRAHEIVLHREGDTERERERYETLLRRSLEEAGRVLREDRCLSLLYPARDPAQLDAFLRLVQPRGFELVEAVRVATDRRPVLKGESQPASYVLLLRKAHAVTAVPLATADAGRVLELADRGKRTLYAAIVDILVSEWEEEDLSDRLTGFVGSREQKIAELVAGSSDPGELLAELGARALRRHADDLEIPKDERPSDAFGLANEILKSIGFTVPEPPVFTFTMQLEIIDRVRAELPLAADLEVLRGRFLTGAQALELAIRYGTVAWLQLLSPQGWLELLEDLFRSVRDEKPFRGPDAFSFGDWIAVFGAVPNLEDQAPVHLRPRFANLRRTLTKRKARQGLDRHVGTRNKIEHNKEGFLEQPFATVRAQTQEGLNEGAGALLTLINERALPQVLQPLEESRDRWNRVLLRAINEKGIRVEMYIEQHLDLTQPCLWFPGGANPREVAPLLVPLQTIEAVTGQRR